MQTDPDKLVKKHHKLTHSDELTVISHMQREKDGWFINSIMLEGCELPFKYKRQQKYKKLNKGQRINVTYYPAEKVIAGLKFDYMKVVRIRIS